MTPIRIMPLGAMLLALAALGAACGPAPTRVPPIERGTALPPPDLPQPTGR
jgi:hypothetical protein